MRRQLCPRDNENTLLGVTHTLSLYHILFFWIYRLQNTWAHGWEGCLQSAVTLFFFIKSRNGFIDMMENAAAAVERREQLNGKWQKFIAAEFGLILRVIVWNCCTEPVSLLSLPSIQPWLSPNLGWLQVWENGWTASLVPSLAALLQSLRARFPCWNMQGGFRVPL